MIRLLVFALLVLALGAGFAWLADRPGELSIVWEGQRADMSLMVAATAVVSLVAQLRMFLRTAGQHNLALFGAGHLGRAIASSHIFADHGFTVVAIFDNDPAKIGENVGNVAVRPVDAWPTALGELLPVRSGVVIDPGADGVVGHLRQVEAALA